MLTAVLLGDYGTSSVRREKLSPHHPSLSLAYTCTYKPWCSGHPRSCQKRWEFPSSYWKLGLPVTLAYLPNLTASVPAQSALFLLEVLGASAPSRIPRGRSCDPPVPPAPEQQTPESASKPQAATSELLSASRTMVPFILCLCPSLD